MAFTKKQVWKLVEYWKIAAEHDYKTMNGLFKIKRYSDCLFFGHIVLEKILKSLVVQKTKNQAPYIHDLTRLSELAECDLTENEKKILDATNKYNIRARYPDYKFRFYKMCTFEYTKNRLNKIKKLYKKLCQELK